MGHSTAGGFRVTLLSARILRVFLEDPAVPRYGFELMNRTGLNSGTVYPILARLTAAGWLTRRLETISPADAGRPARREYTLTPAAADTARAALTAISEEFR